MNEPMITLDAHYYRAAMECMAKADVRYYLNGICVKPNGHIHASNGHVMYTAPYEASGEIDEFIFEPVKIPANKTRVELEVVSIHDKSYVLLTAFDKGLIGDEYLCRIINTTNPYPNWDEVITRNIVTRKQDFNRFSFDTVYTTLLGKVFKKCTPNTRGVTFEMENPDVALVTSNDLSDKGRLMVMGKYLKENAHK